MSYTIEAVAHLSTCGRSCDAGDIIEGDIIEHTNSHRVGAVEYRVAFVPEDEDLGSWAWWNSKHVRRVHADVAIDRVTERVGAR